MGENKAIKEYESNHLQEVTVIWRVRWSCLEGKYSAAFIQLQSMRVGKEKNQNTTGKATR